MKEEHSGETEGPGLMWVMVARSQRVFQKQILPDNICGSEVINDSGKMKMQSLPLWHVVTNCWADKSNTHETIPKLGSEHNLWHHVRSKDISSASFFWTCFPYPPLWSKVQGLNPLLISLQWCLQAWLSSWKNALLPIVSSLFLLLCCLSPFPQPPQLHLHPSVALPYFIFLLPLLFLSLSPLSLSQHNIQVSSFYICQNKTGIKFLHWFCFLNISVWILFSSIFIK